MTDRIRSLLIVHGAIVFLIGLAVGFPFAFAVLQDLDPAGASITVPGDIRAWKMAHLEGVLNGIALIAIAAAGSLLTLSATEERLVFWGLVVTAYGNIIASTLSPITGGRGLAATGFDWNTLVYALFVAAIAGIVLALVIIIKGAIATARS